jgi:DNA-binding NarL/FixJ family response regulator
MRVVIGEDETLLREGLSLLLSNNGFSVAGTASDAQTLIAQTRLLAPNW